MATGHYAQIGYSVQGVGSRTAKKKMDPKNFTLHPSPFTLKRSVDEFKDQTYFIYNIKTEQLPHVLFPVGGMKKSQVRALAQKIKLPNKDKKESMGLCFVGKIRLKDFLEQKLKPKKGSIVNQAGKVVGEHAGLYNYTIGQRQGIKVGGSGPYYVVRKDLQSNTLFVTNNAHDEVLETREVEIHSVNWISAEIYQKSKILNLPHKQTALKLTGRYRHQGDLVPLTISVIGQGHYKVVFTSPQVAVASGQSLVLYKGKECVGGGVIT